MEQPLGYKGQPRINDDDAGHCGALSDHIEIHSCECLRLSSDDLHTLMDASLMAFMHILGPVV